jgi:hypothetical protein
MKCDEVQPHLSDYLDMAAEGPRAKGIEIHLNNCPLCSEEFAGLLQCRQLVSALPEVEPPVGFTTRVMANVMEIATETSLWSRLFSPLKLRIPLQASTVVLIAVLSFYVYQRTDHSKAREPMPAQNVVSPIDDGAAPLNPGEHSAAVAQTENPPAETARETKNASKRSAPRIRSAATETIADNPPLGTAPSRRSAPIQVQGVVAGSGVTEPMRVPRQSPFRLFPAQRELVNLGEPTADYELLVRARQRRPEPTANAGDSTEKSTAPEAPASAAQSGRLIDLEPTSVLNVLWYTVPPDQYKQFKDELAAQARIESEVPIGITDRAYSFRSDGPLFIKVVVLAPTE